MTKIDALRRFLLPCLPTPTSATPPPPPATKKRLSTSLRDDLEDKPKPFTNQETSEQLQHDSSSTSPTTPTATLPPRPSRTMLIGTIFGHRRGGHVWFCVQHDRLNTKPSLLLELSIPTSTLIQEMQCGLVRIALEFKAGDSAESELSRCHLHSIPVWTLFCNGRKLGFAVRRKATQKNRVMLKTMQNITVGAGVIPYGSGSGAGSEDIMYMRANYECVVGSADSESFHLINPDEGPGQELSIFLLSAPTEKREPNTALGNVGREGQCGETDMPEDLQNHAMEMAYQALDLHELSDCQSIARCIKQNFDELYGPTWHCVVEKDFGSCITHLRGSFIFFWIGMMEFLLFKDGEDLSEGKEEAVGRSLHKAA